MPDLRPSARHPLRRPWRWTHDLRPGRLAPDPYVRAGLPAAYLPPALLPLPRREHPRYRDALVECVSLMLDYWKQQIPGPSGSAEPTWLELELGATHAGLETLGEASVPGGMGRRLARLQGRGIEIVQPVQLQRFRDGTADIERRLGIPASGARLLYRWEEPWLRWVSEALQAGMPVLLLVSLGRLHPSWRGLGEPHAVVLGGGCGRQARVYDPAAGPAPVRVGLSRLLNSLLPGEPLATVLVPEGLEQQQSDAANGG